MKVDMSREWRGKETEVVSFVRMKEVNLNRLR